MHILCVTTGPGATHDLRFLRKSKTAIHPDIERLADAGYQGIQYHQPHTRTPKKASKHHPLTDDQRIGSRHLARVRLPVEHVQAAAQDLPHPQGKRIATDDAACTF
jgi:IS5 family transposase